MDELERIHLEKLDWDSGAREIECEDEEEEWESYTGSTITELMGIVEKVSTLKP